jgi:hypothetical protein
VIRHKLAQSSSQDSYIQINEKGWVILYLGKQGKKISISADGRRVVVDNTQRYSGQKEYRPFDSESKEFKLPSKL